MVTVVKRPTGHKLIDQAIAATITEAYGGDALVTFTAHALTTGDTVYIDSNIDEYNGFWYVTVATADTFKISEHETAAFVEYYQDLDIDYYQTQPHDWSSIFLPIIYKITNDKWPSNDLDVERTVLSSSDDNGFTNLTLSGAIKLTVNALEFVKISGASDSINGVWQIVEVVSFSELVLMLPYDASNSFSGAIVQYYYNNYQVKVKVYAGLPATHPWEVKKPYEEVASLSFTPDENNEAMLSVSDYISSKIQIKNNTILYSLPLNLDAFTGYYISTAETYDQSDNYSLYTTEAEYEDDDFEGYAIAGKLPFKNLYAGDYAQYIYTEGYPALWLVQMTRLLAVEDKYFDISFIKNVLGNFRLIIDKYVTDYLTSTEEIEYEDFGPGVYRMPITPDTNYDSFCVRVETDTHEEEVEVIVTEDFDLSLWTNHSEGLTDWTTGIAAPFVNIVGANSEILYFAYPTNAGQTYTYQYEFLIENADPGIKIAQLLFLDAGFLAVGFSFISIPGDGTLAGSVDITPSSAGTYIAAKISTEFAVPVDVTLVSVSTVTTVTEIIEVPGAQVTEEICLDILETCEVQEGFTPEDVRLLEDGDLRLLE